MTALPNVFELNAAVVFALGTTTGKPIDYGRVPEGLTYDARQRLVDPYAIVYNRSGAPHDSNWCKDRYFARIEYQITNVGRTDDHAQWMADANRKAMLGRGAGGGYTSAITAAGARVVDRDPLQLGGPESSGGGLWQVIDVFQLEVESA